VRPLLLLPIVLALGLPTHGEPDSATAEPDFDRLAAPIRQAVHAMTHPELERRRTLLRSMQRHGYAAAVQNILEGDPFSALLVSLRTSVQVEFHLPHTPIVIYIPVAQPPPRDDHLPGFTGAPSPPLPVVLPEDRTFPHDPWKETGVDSTRTQMRAPVP
jgi:hypothetical protein